jgi:hypothetical protein
LNFEETFNKQKNGGWKRREPKTIHHYIKTERATLTLSGYPLGGGGGRKGGKLKPPTVIKHIILILICNSRFKISTCYMRQLLLFLYKANVMPL